LDVIAACENVFDARRKMEENEIRLLFLDVNMPVMDGISFLSTLKLQPVVIFTTAYKEYAVEAFGLAACDYLVKPFSLDRFLIAVDRAFGLINPSAKSVDGKDRAGDEYFTIKTDGKIYRVKYDELIYAEANGNYTKIVTTDYVIIPSMAFSALEEILPLDRFARVHRSFLINKSKISFIEGLIVTVDGKYKIPIGKNYKGDFFSTLGL
jgi:DNA-binding LytR/AlgR family response regulator